MEAVKIIRNGEVISVKPKDLVPGDVFKLYTSEVRECTDFSMYDEDAECYFVRSGIELFSEVLLNDIE